MISLYDGIQRFLENVDPKILERGRDYYRRGCVESVDLDGCFATAEVSGSEYEPYVVDIYFDDVGEVEDWACDCPYDWGPVCKHTVAALLALQKIPQKEPAQNAKTEKVNIKKLVEQADKEQLRPLILEHCREDKRFQSQVLSELEDSGKQELASIKEFVKASIRSNTHQGYIDDDGCEDIAADLDDALDKARRRIGRGQYDRGLEITQFVLLTGMKLINETESGFYYLDTTISAALETVRLAAQKLVESGEDRLEWVRKLLETALDPAFGNWTDWRFDFLEQIAVLADAQNEGEFYGALDRLRDKHQEKFPDSTTYAQQDRLFRYRLVLAVHGETEACVYLEQNLNVDGIRLILAEKHMEEKDYASAERLCLERLETEDIGQWYRPSRWQYLLYEIYQDWGQQEKQIEQARKLALFGDRKFYQTTKELLAEDGRWQEEYPGFLEELKAQRPIREYMEILSLEKESDLLMEQVWIHQDMVFQFGDILAPKYGKEVRRLCTAGIHRASECVNGRKDYQMLCELLRSLAEFGGAEEAGMLIQELRQTYPRRPALLDELSRVERLIAKE